jgi:hypothetical protein
MRKFGLLAGLTAAAVVLLFFGARAPQSVAGPAPGGPPPAPAAPAPPKAYKVVPVQLPKNVADPSFDGFRRQLAGIAKKKDRAALGRIVAQNFFWLPEDKDVADKSKSGLDNFAKAIGLDGRDAPGWEVLEQFADDPTGDAHPQRPGVICGPGEAAFDEKAAEELATATATDPSDWAYLGSNGVQVRSGPAPNSPVIERLGLHLIRIYPDDSPASAVQGADMMRIVTPSGKVGFVPTEQLRGLASDQLCYIKEGNAWKITGVIGGSPPN